MSKRLYVGNLPYSADRESLRALFSPHGSVTDVHVASDRETGRSRGFGFVSFATEEEAQAAVRALNGQDMNGRALVVNVAREREQGGPPGGRRDAGPRAGAPPRPSPRPAPQTGPPLDLPPDEDDARRARHRTKTPRKRPQGDRDRARRPRSDEDDDGLRGGNWRQWLDDVDED